jgi:hypothetical protein
MTNSERILSAAYAVANGKAREPVNQRGQKIADMCLQQVRFVIEDAFEWRPFQWYDEYVTEWVQPVGYDRAEGHWARDAERSLRNLGMSVQFNERKPGDLVFNWETAYSQQWGAYIGHVGVLMHGDLVLENINPRHRVGRAFIRDSTALTPIHVWSRVTSVVRFVPRVEKIELIADTLEE